MVGDMDQIADEIMEIVSDIHFGKIKAKGTIRTDKLIKEKRAAKKRRQLEEELESISATTADSQEERHSSSTVTGSFDSKENCKSSECQGTPASSASNRPHSKPKIILTPINRTRGNSRVKDIPYADGLFPVIKRPLPPVHDPNWPGFPSCMDFDQQLSSWKKITNTMIDPATRAVR